MPREELDAAKQVSLFNDTHLIRFNDKTANIGAFAIPLIQKLLSSKANSSEQCTRSLVLTPTKELSRQVQKNPKLSNIVSLKPH